MRRHGLVSLSSSSRVRLISRRSCCDFSSSRDVDTERARKLRRSAEQRAVPLPGLFSGSTDDVTALALAFARGEVASLAVPYQSWDGPS